MLLFVGFYVISTIIYYTTTWVSYGFFESEPLKYFVLEEFFAGGGSQFIVSFFVTIPIWYVVVVVLQAHSWIVKLSVHLPLMVVYLVACYYLQLMVLDSFGWVFFWGGYKTVWVFYNSMLFYMVQFGFIHAYTYVKKLKREEKEKAELKEIALKSELTALKAQLNPHFLHNMFNSINAAIPPEQERTRELIIQLSDLFRYQNYASQREFVTIKEEIGFLETYLQLMKVRLKERLNYRFEVSTDLYAFKITPMLLHPLVENAVNHGIAQKIEPSYLTIKIVKNKYKVSVSIEDTGIGILNRDNLLEKGIGLSNTRMRLKKIHNCELKIEDNLPSGTKISFEL